MKENKIIYFKTYFVNKLYYNRFSYYIIRVIKSPYYFNIPYKNGNVITHKQNYH